MIMTNSEALEHVRQDFDEEMREIRAAQMSRIDMLKALDAKIDTACAGLKCHIGLYELGMSSVKELYAIIDAVRQIADVAIEKLDPGK